MVNWFISGGVPPKFWFGDRVKYCPIIDDGQETSNGYISGIEWRSPSQKYTPSGWWYYVQWDDRDALWAVHETRLEAKSNG